MRIKLHFSFFLTAFILLSFLGFAQTTGKFFLSISPHVETIVAQTDIRTGGISVGFGVNNHNAYYAGGDLQYSYGFNVNDKYGRELTFNRFSPGAKFKWLLIGNNRYMTDSYFSNTRFCLDLSSHFNFAQTVLKRTYTTTEEGLVNYLSVDLGFSFLIPYRFKTKHKNLFFNSSDLYLEFLATAIINTDIALLNSSSSDIDQVTPAARIALNWCYTF